MLYFGSQFVHVRFVLFLSNLGSVVQKLGIADRSLSLLGLRPKSSTWSFRPWRLLPIEALLWPMEALLWPIEALRREPVSWLAQRDAAIPTGSSEGVLGVRSLRTRWGIHVFKFCPFSRKIVRHVCLGGRLSIFDRFICF